MDTFYPVGLEEDLGSSDQSTRIRATKYVLEHWESKPSTFEVISQQAPPAIPGVYFYSKKTAKRQKIDTQTYLKTNFGGRFTVIDNMKKYTCQSDGYGVEKYCLNDDNENSVIVVTWKEPIAKDAVYKNLEVTGNLIVRGEFIQQQLASEIQSNNADFAEYFPSKDESMEPGDVVCLRDGKLTKTITNATQAYVISTKPAIVGNVPLNGDANRQLRIVALIGQVPVKVRGRVNKDDWIIPSGYNDGTAIGVTEEEYRSVYSTYPRIGQALDEVTDDGTLDEVARHKTVNTLLRPGDPVKTPKSSLSKWHYIIIVILMIVMLLCVGYWYPMGQEEVTSKAPTKPMPTMPPARARPNSSGTPFHITYHV